MKFVASSDPEDSHRENYIDIHRQIDNHTTIIELYNTIYIDIKMESRSLSTWLPGLHGSKYVQVKPSPGSESVGKALEKRWKSVGKALEKH